MHQLKKCLRITVARSSLRCWFLGVHSVVVARVTFVQFDRVAPYLMINKDSIVTAYPTLAIIGSSTSSKLFATTCNLDTAAQQGLLKG